jgi:hypothetical protein
VQCKRHKAKNRSLRNRVAAAAASETVDDTAVGLKPAAAVATKWEYKFAALA